MHGRTHKRVIFVTSAQSGKTETLLDLLGERLDTSPVPIIWVGPSHKAITTQMEPRITDLMDNTCLAGLKGPKSRQRVTRKLVNGVPIRLAHGGSSTALKSDPYGLAITDEADELMGNVRGQGNPIGLIDARGDSYNDFVHVVTSTPSQGVAEVEEDPETGLRFWADIDPDEIKSAIWKLWQQGSKYHWAWPCPHCNEYFIPRFECLKWKKPKDKDGKDLPSTADMAASTAHIECPTCSCEIFDNDEGVTKAWMNERGVYVARGQRIEDGKVVGAPPETWTLSYWASGLCSPLVSWGTRAARYVEAVRSGDNAQIQTAKNSQFGELFFPGNGEVPEWKEVQACAIEDYESKEVPVGVRILTMTVDVQKDRLIYVVRGWGAYGTSWKVESGELLGETEDQAVWDALAVKVTQTWDGIPLKLVLIDSGFRPGKKFNVPVHRVYEFCRKFPKLVKPTKGSSSPMLRPIVSTKVDVMVGGKVVKKSLELLRLDTDHFKQWVQQKVRWAKNAPGSWYLPRDVTEGYCRQIVSEARTRGVGGKIVWATRGKENHFLDCEAMQAACLTLLNLTQLRDGPPRRRAVREAPPEQSPPSVTPPPAPARKPRAKQRPNSIWGGRRESIW